MPAYANGANYNQRTKIFEPYEKVSERSRSTYGFLNCLSTWTGCDDDVWYWLFL